MSKVHFSLRDAFVQCGFRPMTEEFMSRRDNVFAKVLPFYYCGYTEDFFLKITLNEFSFSACSDGHQHKSTALFVARDPRRQHIRRLNRDLPVLVASIVVNRDEFSPLTPGEDEIEWLTKLTPRTKGIAHELLYAQQYLEKYDWPSKIFKRPIVVPSVDEENKLLCPNKEIDNAIHTIEQRHGVSMKNETDFLDLQGDEAMQAYYQMWLKEFVVERDVCHQRTRDYLQNHDRQELHERVLAAFREHIPKDLRRIDTFTKARLHEEDFYHSFTEKVERNGHVDYEVIEVYFRRIFHSERS